VEALKVGNWQKNRIETYRSNMRTSSKKNGELQPTRWKIDRIILPSKKV
jgi:hypothetical protein